LYLFEAPFLTPKCVLCSRVEREARDESEKANLQKANKQDQERIDELAAMMAAGEEEEDHEALEEELKDLEGAIEKRDARLAEMERNKKWNVDNMCEYYFWRHLEPSLSPTPHVTHSPPSFFSRITIIPTSRFRSCGRRAHHCRQAKGQVVNVRASPRARCRTGGTLCCTIVELLVNKTNTECTSFHVCVCSQARERQAAMAKELESGQAAAEPAAVAKDAAKKASKTIVAGPAPQRSVHSYADFVEEHEDLLETYSNLGSLDATEAMLKEKGDVLLVEHASSYLLLSCLEEEMNGPGSKKMKLVARQSQVLSHICELALSLHRPPRDVVVPFFRRIGEKEHGAAFADAVAVFVARIQARAVDKRKEMDEARARQKELGQGDDDDEEQVELSREERMGPGGLDPVEVFGTLPEPLQEAFQSQNTKQLREAIAALPLEEAKYHMKRCEDSGLWVPEK